MPTRLLLFIFCSKMSTLYSKRILIFWVVFVYEGGRVSTLLLSVWNSLCLYWLPSSLTKFCICCILWLIYYMYLFVYLQHQFRMVYLALMCFSIDWCKTIDNHWFRFQNHCLIFFWLFLSNESKIDCISESLG